MLKKVNFIDERTNMMSTATVNFSAQISTPLNYTSSEKWSRSVKMLKPEYFYDDEGYILGENSANFLICNTKRFGIIALDIGVDKNDVTHRLIQKAIGNQSLYPILKNPIRFRYQYNALNDFIITKVMVEKYVAFRTGKECEPMYTRIAVYNELKAEREKAKAKQN